MRASGVEPERLELEITESALLQNDRETTAALHLFRALGMRVAMDNFGTGCSSLSYLRGFPFDTIKIDCSFVGDLHARDARTAIARAIISLGSSSRMTITAEGVETEEQLEFLVTAGCTELQGYLFSKPVPAGEVPALIKQLSALQVSALPGSPVIELAVDH
jgi:EAL domain-containing protein (putative c-di-GMP-specific phosphodiesterase class I)